MFHRTQGGQVLYALWLQGISIVPFERSTQQSILDASCIIFFGFDDLAGEFYSLISFGREAIDVDGAGMDQDADGVAVGGVGISAIDISFEEFGVMFFDVLGSDDDFDLGHWGITLWFENW